MSSAVLQIPEPIYLEALAVATQSMVIIESMHKAWTRRAKVLGSGIPAIKPNAMLTDSADAT